MTAFAFIVWQDWWAIAFAIAGAGIALLNRRGLSPEGSLVAGLELGGAVLCALVGVFLVAAGNLFSDARPCPGCATSSAGIVAAGVVAVGVGMLLGFLALREARRSPKQ